MEFSGLADLGIQVDSLCKLAEFAEFSIGLIVSPRLSIRQDHINVLKAVL